MLKVNQLVGFGAGSGYPYFISSSSGGLSTSLETISWTHTTTSDTSCLVVGETIVKSGADAGTSTVTFNGVTVSQIVEETFNTNNQAVRLFYLLNPPVGSFTLTVQISGTIDRGHGAQALNLGGVRSVGGTTGASNTGSSATATDVLTATRPAIIVAEAYAKHATSGTTPALTWTDPTGAVATQTNTVAMNSLGSRVSLFYTPVQSPGTITCSVTTNVNVTPIMFTAAAFLG